MARGATILHGPTDSQMLIGMTWKVAGVIAAMMLGGCAASAPGPSAQPSATNPAAAATPAATPRFDGQIAVGGGRSLAVWCLGTGSPTILLEGGGTRAGLGEWGEAFPAALARHTTVCLYSHAGGRGSSAAVEPITWAAVLNDADTVLAALHTQVGIAGPYVFVGWSFGGEVALGEAVEDPSRTAGLVILDTDFPIDFMTFCAAAGRTPADCQADFDSDREAKVIEADLVKSIKPLPGIPIALVSALRPSPDCVLAPGATAVTTGIEGKELSAPDCATLWQRIADYDLTQWRSLGPQVTQTTVDADHDRIIELAGSQIVDVIVGVLAQVH
jgi:pimeloyl-ACP methyl ester carboxylesterase